jgi:hypothetical protein
VASFNYAKFQATADAFITKYGLPAVLRRATGDRPCICFLANYSPRELRGSLIQATDQHAFISAVGLTVEPDNEQDKLIFNGVQYDLVAPPNRVKPADVVIYWDLQVRR